jgi:hypothetical protein
MHSIGTSGTLRVVNYLEAIPPYGISPSAGKDA